MPLRGTIAMIKPHAVQANWVPEIVDRYLRAGLKIEAIKFCTFTREEAHDFYIEHKDKPYMEDLVNSMCEGPVVALLLSGKNAITKVRELNGATNPAEAAPGTIRKDFEGPGGPYNTVHGSDGPKAVKRETKIVSKLKLRL